MFHKDTFYLWFIMFIPQFEVDLRVNVQGEGSFSPWKAIFCLAGKKEERRQKKKRKEREIKLCTSSAQDLQTQEWKILNEPLMPSDEECYGGEKKRRKQTNKQEWASMGDWLVVTGSICCCASRTRIAKATSYSVLLGTKCSPAEVMKKYSPQGML